MSRATASRYGWVVYLGMLVYVLINIGLILLWPPLSWVLAFIFWLLLIRR